MSLELLPGIEKEIGARPDASVIWLHGLGADGNDFVPIVPELRLPKALSIRFIFPHAPIRPVTINGGFRMRAWYDVFAADIASRADMNGVRDSQARIEALIAHEKTRGIRERRILLAGFSQGGVIALQAGLTHAERLGGIIALSTYLVQPDQLAASASPANRDVPIFMAHGTDDPVIRLAWATASRHALEANGYAVEWHTYPMPHSVVMEEIAAIGGFIARSLA